MISGALEVLAYERYCMTVAAHMAQPEILWTSLALGHGDGRDAIAKHQSVNVNFCLCGRGSKGEKVLEGIS